MAWILLRGYPSVTMNTLKIGRKNRAICFSKYKLNALTLYVGFIFGLAYASPLYAQTNTASYQFLPDTIGSLSLDRNGNVIVLSDQADIISPLSQQVNSAVINLPFDVFFMGSSYSHFMVNVNGCLVMAPSASISFTPSLANNYTGVASQYAVFAPFWDVLKTPATKGVKYTVSGVAPYRSLTVEWYALPGSVSTSTDFDMQFQFRLYESSNIIEYVYGKMQIGQNVNTPITTSIGFSTAAAGRDSSFISVMNIDSFYVSRLRTDLAASQNLVNTQASGVIKGLHNMHEGHRTRLAFVPYPILAPGNLITFNVSSNEALLYWDDYTTDEIGFKLYRVNKINEPEFDTTLAANITFRNLANLLPGTTYQYRVQGYNNYTSAYSNIVTFRTADADTLYAVQSGNWNDTATWGGFVPGKNTVVEIPASFSVKLNINEARCHQLIVYGELTFADQATSQKLYVNYDVVNYGSINAWPTPTYNNTGNEIIIGRNVLNNNILNLFKTTSSYTNAISLRFTGNDHSKLTGNGDTTNIYALISDKSGAKDSLTINPIRLTVKGAATDLESNGALLSASVTHTGIVLIGGSYILQNRVFPSRDLASVKGFSVVVDNPGFTVTPLAGDFTINGLCLLKLKQGSITIQGSLQLGALASLVVEGGEFMITNQLKNYNTTSDAFFTQNGGRIITGGLVFNATQNNINLLDGVLISDGNAQLLADLSVSKFGKHKMLFGTSINATVKQYTISGVFAGVFIDSIVNTASVTELTLNGNTIINNALFIGSNDTIEIGLHQLTINADSVTINGSIQSNDIASKIIFSSPNNQVVSGNGNLKVSSVEISKEDTFSSISFNIFNPLMVNNIGFYGGKIIHADKLKVGNISTTSIVRIGRSNIIGNGSYLDVSPDYVNPKQLYIEYNTEYSQRNTGCEIPLSRKISGLFFANGYGVKIGGGDIEVTDTLVLQSGKVESSLNNQVVFTDTSNSQSMKVISGSYFTGPFTRSIPVESFLGGNIYEFPIGTIKHASSLSLYNPIVSGKAINIQGWYLQLPVTGVAAPTLQNLSDTGFWQLTVLNNRGNLTSFSISVPDDELTSISKLALAKSSAATLKSTDVFYPAGERISYLIDSLRSDIITASTIDSFYYFAKADLIPDTLSKPIYKIGQGEDFENLTAVAKLLGRTYIDSLTVFEITQNYSSNKEVFPIGFEQMLYTNSEYAKNVTIRLSKNVTGIVTTNIQSFASNNALLNFYGVDSLTLDGMGYDVLGMPTGKNEWSVQTATAGIPTVSFVGDASFNKLRFLNIIGNNNVSSSGTIVLGSIIGEQTGNDFNTIENNTITSLSTTLLSANHIISSGASGSVKNDNNKIINNKISDFSLAGINITPTGNGSGWLLEGNSIFQTFTYATANTAINFVPGIGSGNNKIRLNAIGGTSTGSLWNYSGTAALSVVVLNVDTVMETVVADNIIKGYNLSNSGTANGLMAITANNGKINIIANKIGGPETAGKITIAGRGLSALIRSLANMGQVNISDNIITNIDQSVAAGTTNKVRAISVEGLAIVNINNNSISNIIGRGTSSSYRDASLTGIYVSGSSSNTSITANRIYNLSIASTSVGYVTGLSINGVTSGNISANNLYNLTNSSTTAGSFITGISVEFGSWLISNNKIVITNIGNEARSIMIHGLRVSTALPYKSKVFHNTVYIGGTTVGTSITSAGSFAFYQSAATTDLQIMNNLFVNARGNSNIHPAAYFVVNPGLVSDFNHYQGRGTSTVLSTSGTLRSFSNFQSFSGSDKNSTSDITPSFENIPENITPKDTVFNCFIKGTGVANIETDYSGKIRHTIQPDRGADEFLYSALFPQSPFLIKGNDTLCAGSSRVLFVNQPAAGDDVQWFDKPVGGNLLFTGFDFTTGKITSDTVFYAQVISGSCKGYRTAIPIKVKPSADVQFINAPLNPLCGGNSLTLQTIAKPGNSVNWFVDSLSTTPIANGNDFTTGVLNSDTIFFVEASNGICPSVRKKASITIDNNIATQPPVIDTLFTVCKGDSLVLKALSNYNIAWYAKLSGPVIGTDSVLVLDEVMKDTFYYVASTNGSCVSSPVKVHIKVNNKPVLPVVDSIINVCGNQAFSVSLNVSEGKINWYTDTLNPIPLYTGTQLDLPGLLTDSIFYVEVTNGNCPATLRKPITLKPALVNAPIVNPVSIICKNTAIQLVVNNAPLNGQAEWYTSLTDTIPFYSGNIFNTSSLARDTQFYLQLKENTCVSERIVVSVPVVESVDVPTLIHVDSICKGALATISVSSVLPVRWYANAISNDVISSDYYFTAGLLSTDSVFYVAAVNGNCYSPRLALKVHIKPAPQPPLFTPLSTICAGSALTLNVSAPDSVKWYATVSSTTPINRGNTFVTPKLNATTTYYLETDNGICRSERIAMPLTVLPALPSPVVTALNNRTCFNESVILRASATSTINWYASEISNIVLQRDSIFTTERLKNDTVFYAENFDGLCRSPRVAVPVSVLNYVGNLEIILPDSAILDQPIVITSIGLPSSVYSWEFGSGSSLSGATGQGPFNLSYSTAGEKTIKLNVSRKSGNLICDTVIVKHLNVIDTTPYTGLKSIKNQFYEFKAYPNPVKEVLTISFKTDKPSPVKVQIIDLTGRVLWENESEQTSTYNTAIDVRNFGKGMHIIRMISDEAIQTNKVIIE